MKIGRKIAMPCYLWPQQHKDLKQLAKRTGKPMQEHLREGVDLVLAKHKVKSK